MSNEKIVKPKSWQGKTCHEIIVYQNRGINMQSLTQAETPNIDHVLDALVCNIEGRQKYRETQLALKRQAALLVYNQPEETWDDEDEDLPEVRQVDSFNDLTMFLDEDEMGEAA